MRTVRRLWAVGISFGIVLFYAFVSALAVDTTGWYANLLLPPFAPSEGWYTPLWALVYAADVAALGSLIFRGESGARLYLPLSAGAMNAFWCYVFFRLDSVVAGAVTLALIVAVRALCAALNFRKNKFSAAVFLLETFWFLYLFAVNVCIRAA